MYLSKCCFWLPLRKGLLIAAYTKLVLFTSYAIYWLSEEPRTAYREETRNDSSILLPIIVLGAVIVLEIIFSIILLIGVHKINYTTVRITYIYNAILIGVEIMMSIVYIPLESYRLYASLPDDVWLILLTSMSAALLAIVIQLYMVALVRSYLFSLRQQCVSDPESSSYSPRKPYVVY
ncbi:unnamed protein product [Leptosia nina]|uniref:Uncharacterized protein n=1 Tax=Leptosia nina TaxID=320188 RepID=A0AAV1J3E5_9NEOP